MAGGCVGAWADARAAATSPGVAGGRALLLQSLLPNPPRVVGMVVGPEGVG